MPSKTYHQSYHAKQLFGTNAVVICMEYHQAFPKSKEPHQKMLLINQLIYAFHIGLTEIGR